MTHVLSIDELLENFSAFDDWEDRYQYLIELGKSLPPMEAGDRTESNRVEGCMSQVWIKLLSRADGRLDFVADSDALIVRGLIAVLRIVYAGKTQQEVLETDINGIFGRLGLDRHLSANRRNGFHAMVGKLRAMATGI